MESEGRIYQQREQKSHKKEKSPDDRQWDRIVKQESLDILTREITEKINEAKVHHGLHERDKPFFPADHAGDILTKLVTGAVDYLPPRMQHFIPPVLHAYDILAYDHFSPQKQELIRQGMKHSLQVAKNAPDGHYFISDIKERIVFSRNVYQKATGDHEHPDRFQLSLEQAEYLKCFTDATDIPYNTKQRIFSYETVLEKPVPPPSGILRSRKKKR